MKLYYSPQTRAGRPRWLLEEIGAPYEIASLDLKKGEHKQPEYMKIHPHGAVPALIDGDLALFESAAICMYLADKYPEKKLAPALGTPARGEHLAKFRAQILAIPERDGSFVDSHDLGKSYGTAMALLILGRVRP